MLKERASVLLERETSLMSREAAIQEREDRTASLERKLAFARRQLEAERDAFRVERDAFEVEKSRFGQPRRGSMGSGEAQSPTDMEGVMEIPGSVGPKAIGSRVPRRSFVPKPLEERK
jgi:hypothetical protein